MASYWFSSFRHEGLALQEWKTRRQRDKKGGNFIFWLESRTRSAQNTKYGFRLYFLPSLKFFLYYSFYLWLRELLPPPPGAFLLLCLFMSFSHFSFSDQYPLLHLGSKKLWSTCQESSQAASSLTGTQRHQDAYTHMCTHGHHTHTQGWCQGHKERDCSIRPPHTGTSFKRYIVYLISSVKIFFFLCAVSTCTPDLFYKHKQTLLNIYSFDRERIQIKVFLKRAGQLVVVLQPSQASSVSRKPQIVWKLHRSWHWNKICLIQKSCLDDK